MSPKRNGGGGTYVGATSVLMLGAEIRPEQWIILQEIFFVGVLTFTDERSSLSPSKSLLTPYMLDINPRVSARLEQRSSLPSRS